MRDELSLHLLILVSAVCKLVYSFGRTELNEVPRQCLHYLMCLQSDLRLAVVNQAHQTVAEVWMRDKVCKHSDMLLVHQRQRFNEELQFFDVQVVDVLLAAELKLL